MKADRLSLQKRRKFLLILLGVYIAFLLIMTIIRGISFLKINGIVSFINYFFFLAVFLYAFFRKDKEQNSTDKLEKEELNDSKI
jgi:Ca2+/Na+ antiporter